MRRKGKEWEGDRKDEGKMRDEGERTSTSIRTSICRKFVLELYYISGIYQVKYCQDSIFLKYRIKYYFVF